MGNQAQLDKSTLCDCSVQERIGTYSGTYRNGNEMATLGQEWESKCNWTSPSEAIGPYPISQISWRSYTECIGTYTERVQISCNSREFREGCTERIRTYNFPPKSFILCGERIRNVYGTYRNVYQFTRMSRGLYGTYRNVYISTKVFHFMWGTYTERIRDV